MRCDICIKELCYDMSKQIELLKKLHFLVSDLNKLDISPREEIFGVYKQFMKKLTDCLLTIIDLGTASFGNES